MRRTQLATAVLEESDLDYIDLLLFAYGLPEETSARQSQELLQQGRGIRSLCYRISNYWAFKGAAASLIIVSVVLVAVEADAKAYREIFPEDSLSYRSFLTFMEAAEHAFTSAFVLELLIRAVGSPVSPWNDGWLVADGVIVGTAVLDTWVLAAFQSADFLASFSSFRAIRMIRAMRALRIIRIFRYIRSLRLFAEALSEAFQHIFWMILITFLITWSGSVIFTSSMAFMAAEAEAARSADDDTMAPETFFNSVASSLLVLNMVLIRGIQWGNRITSPFLFSEDVRRAIWGGVFLAFVLGMVIGFLNVIHGVFITSLLEAAQRDTLFIQRKSLTNGEVSLLELKRAFEMLDVRGNGGLTFEDFQRGMKNHPHLCSSIGLHPDKAGAIYRQLDGNRSGLVSLDEFLVGFLKLTWTSKSIDMLCMDYMQMRTFRDLYKLGQKYDRDFQSMKATMHDIDESLMQLRRSVHCLSGHLTAGFADDEDKMRNSARSAGGPALRARVSIGKTDQEVVTENLESKFSFQTRLEALKVLLRSEMVSEVQRGNSELVNIPKEMWGEVLLKEAMPWLHKRIATWAPGAQGTAGAIAEEADEAAEVLARDAAAKGSLPSSSTGRKASSYLRPHLLTRIDIASPWYNPRPQG